MKKEYTAPSVLVYIASMDNTFLSGSVILYTNDANFKLEKSTAGYNTWSGITIDDEGEQEAW